MYEGLLPIGSDLRRWRDVGTISDRLFDDALLTSAKDMGASHDDRGEGEEDEKDPYSADVISRTC